MQIGARINIASAVLLLVALGCGSTKISGRTTSPNGTFDALIVVRSGGCATVSSSRAVYIVPAGDALDGTEVVDLRHVEFEPSGKIEIVWEGSERLFIKYARADAYGLDRFAEVYGEDGILHRIEVVLSPSSPDDESYREGG